MKIVSLLGNKYFLWAIVILGIFGIFGWNAYTKSKYEQDLATYKRQLAGQLSEKERELQTANNQLGTANSKLISQIEMNKQLSKENAEMKKFIKENELVLSSKDQLIAQLKQKIVNGNTNVDMTKCVDLKTCIISYTWADSFGRFKLIDTNILIPGNSVFSAKQIFSVEGEVFKQSTGYLEVRKVSLNEVYLATDETYKVIPGTNVSVIDSKFQYVNEPSVAKNKFFNPRLIAVASYDFDSSFKPGLGVEFLQYKNWGLNSFTSVNTKLLKNSQQKLGVLYSPKVFGSVPLNIGIGGSIGTPFNNLFKSFGLSLDVSFYINN